MLKSRTTIGRLAVTRRCCMGARLPMKAAWLSMPDPRAPGKGIWWTRCTHKWRSHGAANLGTGRCWLSGFHLCQPCWFWAVEKMVSSGPLVKCCLLAAFKRLLRLKVLSWHKSMADGMKSEKLWLLSLQSQPSSPCSSRPLDLACLWLTAQIKAKLEP